MSSLPTGGARSASTIQGSLVEALCQPVMSRLPTGGARSVSSIQGSLLEALGQPVVLIVRVVLDLYYYHLDLNTLKIQHL